MLFLLTRLGEFKRVWSPTVTMLIAAAGFYYPMKNKAFETNHQKQATSSDLVDIH